MRPANGEGQVTPHDPAPKTYSNQHTYFALEAPGDQDLDDEFDHFTSLRAKLADRGYRLSPLSCGGFLIARWNLTRNAPDLRSVGKFLRMVGGAV